MKKIKSLLLEERPREKLRNNGVQSLANAELLAILLDTGTKTKSAIDIGEEIISKAEGISNLSNYTLAELINIDGIGLAKASKILAALELSKRISKSSGLKQLQFDSPISIFETYSEEMRYLKKEVFKILLLDTKHRPISDVIISEGSLNASLVHPREVMMHAVKNSASKIILLHNHPSGDPTPSTDDMNITKTLRDCGELLDIPVLDHIIIGNGSYYSFKENGLVFR